MRATLALNGLSMELLYPYDLSNSTITNLSTAQKMKFSIKDFLSKCDQILITHLLKKSLMENFIFCAGKVVCLQFFPLSFLCDGSLFSFTDVTYFFMFLILLMSFNEQVLLRNLLFLDLYMYSFEIRRTWFWIK